MKKRVICYGDSNTWGWTPMTFERYDETIRWPARLRQLLGPDYEIEEEGLPGRTTAIDDPLFPCGNGRTYMPTCLLVNAPVDLLVFMLGTNDFQMHLNGTAQGTARSIRFMLENAQQMPITRAGTQLRILLLCPASISEHRFGYQPSDLISQRDIESSRALREHLPMMAQQLGCEYLDLNDYVKVSERDGLHFEPEAHIKISEVIAAKIQEMLA